MPAMPSAPTAAPRWPWLAMPAAALALAVATLWLATSSAPAVSGAATPSARTGIHMRQWLLAHDPRLVRDGGLLTLRADDDELQWVADQAAHLAGGAARTRIEAGRLHVAASLPVGPRWVDVELELGEGGSLPDLVRRLRIGRIALPLPLARAALRFALATWWDRGTAVSPPLHTMLQDLRLQPGQLRLAYRWRADLPQRLADWAVPAPQLERMHVYHLALIDAVRRTRRPQELPDLMAPLFALAHERSAAGADPVEENRAALLALAVYASRRPAASIWPAARAWPAVPVRGLQLGGRGDFPRHFLLSAAIAAERGGPLADSLGLLKEVGDSRGGSGFSFTDIAVNRAGTRFGELAVRDPRRVQALIADGAAPGLLVPDVSDLPEFMPQREFAARFGGIGAPAYEAMRAEIEARIGALALYR